MIYLNGDYLDGDDICSCIDIRDRGLLLGDGVFETLYLREGVPVFLAEHLNRLKRACCALEIPIEIDLITYSKILQKLTSHDTEQDFSARITVTRGVGSRGLLFPKKCTPTLLISVAPLTKGDDTFSFVKSRFVRCEHSLTARYKTLNYLDNIMARNESAKAGHMEALMCNSQGRVASGAYSNIFFIKDGGLLTPSLDEGSLDGIVRSKIIKLAAPMGLTLEETKIEYATINSMGCFFTNSLIGIVPAQNLMQSPHMEGERKIVEKLKNAYESEINRDVKASKLSA